MTYPNLIGKKLLNNKSYLNMYYPQDLYSIIIGDNVVIITRTDIDHFLIYSRVEHIGIEEFMSIFTPENIPYLTETPSEDIIKDLFSRYICEP